MKKQITLYETSFCPVCEAYSGETFRILAEGDNPPDSEVLQCCCCGWVGSWDQCKKRHLARDWRDLRVSKGGEE